jgi:hypothetical protein
VTVHSLPQVRVDGVLLDPWLVLLPLEYGYGRQQPTQQPDPGGCQFEYVGEPTFQRGSRLEVLLDGEVVWRGDVTGREVSWQSINEQPVYEIVGTGWAYRLNRVFLREPVWIPAGTDAQQVAAVLAAFAPLLDAGIDPPVTIESVTDPAILQGWWLREQEVLLQVLGEHASSTGAVIWEDADGVHYVGPPYREFALPPTETIKRSLIEMPVAYRESPVINRVLLTFGRFPQDSDGSTMGEWRWRAQTAAPAAGEVAWDAALQRLRLHEVDNNGTNQRLNLLSAIEGNGVYVLSPVEERRLTGVIDQRSVSGQVFTLTLIETDPGAAGLPTNNAVCSVSTGAPSGEQTLLVEDLPSQAQYGPQEVSTTTYYADLLGVGPRGNRLLARWKRPRWLHEFLVNLYLPSTQPEFAHVAALKPNDRVFIDGIDESRPGVGGGSSVFVEGVVHSWDRTDEGAPVFKVQIGASPVSAWTELGGYGTGPYGTRPYGGSA